MNQRSFGESSAGGAAIWLALAERVIALARQMRRGMAAAGRPASMGETELLALWACSFEACAGINQSRLCARLGVSPAQVSGVVDSLRRRGLLTGDRDQSDRRRQLWRPTPEGLSVLAEVCRHAEQLWATAADGPPSPGRIDLLIDELDRLLAAFPAADYLPDPRAAATAVEPLTTEAAVPISGSRHGADHRTPVAAELPNRQTAEPAAIRRGAA